MEVVIVNPHVNTENSNDFWKECCDLLVSLKSTVEGLLALPCNNVWSMYGGLDRLAKSVEGILVHRLRRSDANGVGVKPDFWQFIRGLNWLNPTLAPSIEQLNRDSTKQPSSKGMRWLRQSLEAHSLSSQLNLLVGNRQHLLRYYHSEAFLCQPEYYYAMVVCLNAVEQNNPALLAEINPSMIFRSRCVKQMIHSRSLSLPVINFLNEGSVDTLNSSPSYYQITKSNNPTIICDASSAIIETDYRRNSCDISNREAFVHMYGTPDTDFGSDSSGSSVNYRMSDPLTCHSPTTSSLESSRLSRILPEDSTNFDTLDDLMCRDPMVSSVQSYLASVEDYGVSESSGFIKDSIKLYRRNNKGRFLRIRNVNTASNDHGRLNNLKKKADRTSKYIETKGDELAKNPEEMSSELRSSQLMLDLILNSDDVDVGRLQSKSNVENMSNENLDRVEDMKIGSMGDKEKFNSDCLSNLDLNANSKKMGHARSSSDIGVPTSKLLGGTSASRTIIQSSTMDSISTSCPTKQDFNSQYYNGEYLRRPVEGQSLISFLSSHDFNTCTDLERENAHFSFAEALIAAIEQMKWNRAMRPQADMDIDESSSEDKKQRIRYRRSEKSRDPSHLAGSDVDGMKLSVSTSSFETLSADNSGASSDEVHDAEVDDSAVEAGSNLTSMKDIGLSLSMASLYSDADIKRPIHKSISLTVMKQSSTVESLMESQATSTSADVIAMNLLKRFSEKHLPKASELVWLVSEQDAPQSLLPLPDSFPISPDDGENGGVMQNRIRGSMEWAPPRAQIICSIPKKLKLPEQLVRQNNRCAGCGSKVEPGCAKRLRYCEYLGKYFCLCCHNNERAYIPGRILSNWDFTKYSVSNFSHEFLHRIYNEPYFSIESTNYQLYQKVRPLDQLRECRVQLHYLAHFMKTCKGPSPLARLLEDCPLHWYSSLDVIHTYSLHELVMVRESIDDISTELPCLNDLENPDRLPVQQVKKKELLPLLKDIVDKCILHVSECLLCQAKGFICEICRNGSDVIYPFELQKVSTCSVCRASFHRACFNPESCPKCARMRARRKSALAVETTKSKSPTDSPQSTERADSREPA